MSNNLIVSYDLNIAGQKYDAVIECIKTLGSWAKVQRSVWYLSTNYSEQAAADMIYKVMDSNDSLLVVNASRNEASWYGVSDDVAVFIKDQWTK
ncbi:CRISPR-associated protein Cas2 [Neptunomonas sp.]|uniref:CRISPR-associated protein Cas2 n=1 Tax=Neptunomonas sp. TaxID=1971898 RepID=UPI003564F495